MEANRIMKRLFVLSLLSLALAGCAQSKGALSRGASYPPSPVAITPVPSIHDTINEGMGGKVIAQTAMNNPDDPHWSGRTQVASVARPVPPGPPSATQGRAAMAAASPDAIGTRSVDTTAPASTGPALGVAPAVAAAGAAPAVLAPLAEPYSNAAAPSPVMAGPAPALPIQSRALGDQPSAPADAAAAGPQLAGSVEPSGESIAVPSGPQTPALSPITPVAVAVAPGLPASPATATAAALAPNIAAPTRAADPLLGPDPDLMPLMPELSSGKKVARQGAAPAGPPSLEVAPAENPEPAPPAGLEVAPAVDPTGALIPELPQTPAPGPGPGPAPAPALDPAFGVNPLPLELPATQAPAPPAGTNVAPAPLGLPASVPPAAAPAVPGNSLPVDPPIQLERSSAASKPVKAGLAAAGPPLGAAPAGSEPAPATQGKSLPKSAALVDRHVILTSAGSPAGAVNKRKYSGKGGGKPMARVGDEVITFHDLDIATKEALSKYPLPPANDFDTASAMQRRQQIDLIAREVLMNLIDQSLLVQEAKRHMKDKAMLERAYEIADKIWHEEEVVPLERKLNVDSEAKLREKLAEGGRSLDAMKQNFRQYFLAQHYLHEKLRDRLSVELPDLLKYYNDNVHQHAFDRPAQITWREIVVEIDNHKSREEAQARARSLLEKVRRGDDFARLARAESEGPTSSRNLGGLMQTTPGSYAVNSINDALGSLQIGQVSGLLEGPDSFHILRVEKRRPAGPASFEEVQDQIKPLLVSKKSQQERNAYLSKLKQNALITIYGENGNDATKLPL
jgi:peptidyl-prolyl cis-trans isomerase SurA